MLIEWHQIDIVDGTNSLMLSLRLMLSSCFPILDCALLSKFMLKAFDKPHKCCPVPYSTQVRIVHFKSE